MLRVISIVASITLGVITGLILGVLGGLAFIEFGRHACSGIACADEIVRMYMPIGALSGGIGGMLLSRRSARARGAVSGIFGR
jgi:hypothetical protein